MHISRFTEYQPRLALKPLSLEDGGILNLNQQMEEVA